MTYHSLEGPHWIGGLRLGRDTVVDRVTATRGRTTANEDFEESGVRCVLWEKNHGSLELVSTATGRIVDCCRHVGKLLDDLEGLLIQDTGLVVVGDEDSRWDNADERIEVEWLGPVEEGKVDSGVGVSAGGACLWHTGGWEELKGWLLSSIASNLTTDNQDRSIGHDHSRRIPTWDLKRQDTWVFLPFCTDVSKK